MLGAGTARSNDLLPERLARSKRADRGVRARDAALIGKLLDRETVNVDPLEDLGVLGLQRPGQSSDTLANGPSNFHRWSLVRLHLGRKSVETTLRGILAATVINDSVTKQSIKPGYGRFSVAQLTRPLNALGKRVLEQVLGDRAVSNPSFEKRKEDAMVVDERRENLGFGFLAVAGEVHALSLP